MNITQEMWCKIHQSGDISYYTKYISSLP